MSEIESREFPKFKNQPKGMQFQLMNKEGNAGAYKEGENKTFEFSPNAYLFSIQLSDR
jgi:hypothetical protein